MTLISPFSGDLDFPFLSRPDRPTASRTGSSLSSAHLLFPVFVPGIQVSFLPCFHAVLLLVAPYVARDTSPVLVSVLVCALRELCACTLGSLNP